MTGAMTIPVKRMYWTSAPIVHVPSISACPPSTIISAPMMPMMRVASDPTADTPTTAFATLRKSRCTPLAKTICSRRSDAVGLDDADATERLAQASGHFRVDLAALPEHRAQAREGHGEHGPEDDQGNQRHRREPPVEIEEPGQGDRGRERAPDELHEARADEVPDPPPRRS